MWSNQGGDQRFRNQGTEQCSQVYRLYLEWTRQTGPPAQRQAEVGCYLPSRVLPAS